MSLNQTIPLEGLPSVVGFWKNVVTRCFLISADSPDSLLSKMGLFFVVARVFLVLGQLTYHYKKWDFLKKCQKTRSKKRMFWAMHSPEVVLRRVKVLSVLRFHLKRCATRFVLIICAQRTLNTSILWDCSTFCSSKRRKVAFFLCLNKIRMYTQT